MRGHQPLVAMRLRGKCPDTAWIHVGTDRDKAWRDWPRDLSLSPIAHIEIQDREPLSTLASDLRCLVGMCVIVQGDSPDRVLPVADMALQAQARRVFASFIDPDNGQLAGVYITEAMQQWQDF